MHGVEGLSYPCAQLNLHVVYTYLCSLNAHAYGLESNRFKYSMIDVKPAFIH